MIPTTLMGFVMLAAASTTVGAFFTLGARLMGRLVK